MLSSNYVQMTSDVGWGQTPRLQRARGGVPSPEILQVLNNLRLLTGIGKVRRGPCQDFPIGQKKLVREFCLSSSRLSRLGDYLPFTAVSFKKITCLIWCNTTETSRAFHKLSIHPTFLYCLFSFTGVIVSLRFHGFYFLLIPHPFGFVL